MDGRSEGSGDKKNGYQPDEDMFRFMIENSGDILWTIDLTGRWQFMTSNVEKAIHIKASEIIGKMVWDFVAPEYVGILKDMLKRRLAGEDMQAYEVVVLDRDGKRVPFEVKTSPIVDKNGKIIGIQGVSRDISQRKNAEAALRESEKKFRDLVESIHDWVWEANRKVEFTYSSPRVLDLLGYAPREIIGRPMWDFMEPAEARRISAILQNLIRLHKQYDIAEKTMLSKKGDPVAMEMTLTLTYDEKGDIKGFKGICRDIRDRKRAEEALRRAYGELEKRVQERTRDLAQARGTLQGILDTAPIGIVVANAPDGNISFSSPGAEKIFAGEASGNIYNPMIEQHRLLRTDGSPFTHNDLPFMISLEQGKRIIDAEMQYIKQDGRTMSLLVSSAPILDEKGKILAAVATIVDITRLKSTERELREAKAQAELYLDLMSHDINNMNTMAMGYIDMAKSRVEADRETVALLEKSGEMLASSTQLIDNVRKIQQAEQRGLEPQIVDLCEVIDRAKKRYSTGNITITATYPEGRACMVTANQLIEDVFTNLIDNSIKHATPGKPVHINIVVAETKRAGSRYYRVTVEDDGPGIPDDVKDRLFIRFQRGKTKVTGRGLGLYLVKTLVEDFGGCVRVEDRVKGNYHEGTRFIVLLPVSAREPEKGTGACAG
ncbi:PAS domain-containing protein [Methanocella arvoryzae]|uniref:histidine kinase n=1 Tax=Methanocella arvoryzae (strain DSM 22066 / NBRC 105507 / MRE50) TaxID=351160 RepID=Q0W563_METAR|nr:PAS domain-containing sensor histidine kinase [Methanocella arvoryzae]CAJ36480.1 putative signal transduction histidine kinase [Methanocella arvoryzae MRE50]